MSKVKKALLVLGVLVLGFSVTRMVRNSNPTDIHKNSVMILNKEETHGGTGIIFHSTKAGSFVLTNFHVCNAIKSGGVIKATTGDYQVQSFLESQVSDLCFIYTPADLKQMTSLASKEPAIFGVSKAVGHPALMPTVISVGHFSERKIISVMTGTRPCTDADKDDPINSMYCAFFGAVPVIKSYDSQLITSTIMPGSSGSGVYNANNELSAVVFAGQGDFGYGWVVPYDQVKQFLNFESFTGKWQTIDQTLNKPAEEEKTTTKDMQKKCIKAKNPKIVQFCQILKRDLLWNE